ncbi:MAG: hypothetical protein MZV64_73085 [Ignavibacteriales bacterium]|nr:hypothetical protein [Ignavibacteriales bacterium]
MTFEAITRHPVDHEPVDAPAPTPTSSTSRWPRRSTCCSSRRPPRTSSASSPSGIADDFLSRPLPGDHARPCSWRRP